MAPRINRAPQSPARHESIELLRKLRKLAGLLGVSSYRRGLRYGVAAAIEHQGIPYRSSVDAVIDVGAHHGQFALFALHTFPNASMYCFEPLPQAAQALRKSVGRHSNVHIVEKAASNESGTTSMHVSRLDDSSSLLPIGDRYVAAFPGTEEAGTAEVPMIRVDEALSGDALGESTLMKIDVQGYEQAVLDGSSGVLDSIKQIVIEVSFLELYRGQTLAGGIVSHLNGRGFDLSGVFNLKRDRSGRCLQSDFLFDRTETQS